MVPIVPDHKEITFLTTKPIITGIQKRKVKPLLNCFFPPSFRSLKIMFMLIIIDIVKLVINCSEMIFLSFHLYFIENERFLHFTFHFNAKTKKQNAQRNQPMLNSNF